MDKRDSKQIMREFRLRQSRQILAIAVALFLVIAIAVLYKRPDRFGEFSKNTPLAVQFVLIMAFVVFTAYNWRCPSCNKYLGKNIDRRICKQCGTKLR